MLLLKPHGGIVTGAPNSPEQLIIYAPKPFQTAAMLAGGLNIFGKCKFRVVWQPSCFAISGGEDIKLFNEWGAVVGILPNGVVLIPKYNMPSGWEDCYLIEKWMPPEFYAGREWSEAYTQIRGDGVVMSVKELPHIPSHGDYEAMEGSMGVPYPLFNRLTRVTGITGKEGWVDPSGPEEVYDVIRAHLFSYFVTPAQRMTGRMAAAEKEKQNQKAQYVDIVVDALGPFTSTPHSGYGQKSEGRVAQ